MSILITNSMTKLCRTLIMCILKVRRDRTCLRMSYQLHRLIYCHDRRIAFWSTCHIRCGLSQYDPRLRHTEPFHCLGGTDGHHQCLWISVRHILRRTDHDPAGNERHILPGIQHPCQIIHSRIRIRSPHAFDKCRYSIIMIISGFIITQNPFLDTFLCHIQSNMYLIILTAFCR